MKTQRGQSLFMSSTSTRIALFLFISLFLTGNMAGFSLEPTRLDLMIQSDHGDMCQIFFDTGAGFSEEESEKSIYQGEGKFQRVHFHYSKGKVTGLRIDPGTREGLYLIKSIRLLRLIPLYEFPLMKFVGTATSAGIRDLRWEDGTLRIESTGGDPAFRIPVDHAAVLATSRKVLRMWWNVLLLVAFLLFLARMPLMSTTKKFGTVTAAWWKGFPLFRKAATGIFLLSPLILFLPVHLPYSALVMEVKVQRDSLFQVFFDRGDGFNEKDSYKFYVRNGEDRYQTARVRVLPQSERFRIDPGTSPSVINIGAISLTHGLITVHSWGPGDIVRDFKPIKDIRSFEVHEGTLRVATSGSDPSFMTVADVSRLSAGGLNLALFIFALFLGTAVFFLAGIRKMVHPLRKSLRSVTIFLALVSTPLLLFISSSSSLYLGNQELLGHQAQVLMPFAAVFFVGIGVGAAVYGLRRWGKNRWTAVVLWFYFILGPAFLFFQSLKTAWPFLDTLAGTFLVLFLCFAVGVFSFRSIEPRRAVPSFAFFSFLLIVYEIFNFVTAFEPSMVRADGSQAIRHEAKATAGKTKLPNIYHIVLDEYQTDMFEKTLTADVKKALAGFIFYPNNVTNYGGTTLSIPSVFTGSRYDLSDSPAYHRAAFQEGPSMLIPLKEAGFMIYGFIFKIGKFYPVQPALFDHMTDMMDESFLEKFGNAGETFRMLWIYRNMPAFISRLLISPDDLQSLLNKQGMPGHFELMSRAAFMNYLGIEKFLPGHNRYTFFHFLLPHTPYILSADCSYCMKKNGLQKTSSHEQAQCTTKLVIQFVETLNALNRFKDAMIVIHADHGRRKDLTDIASLDLARDACKALLLVKPPGRGAGVPFETSMRETMLLDVPPTILSGVGRLPPPSLEGLSLLDPPPAPGNRTRPFMIYDDKRYVLYEMREGEPVLKRIIAR